ncbi:hypothetical protein ACOAKC_12750 [Hathewaya histolytica]|uniref:hypothetical protein n=1 Tax=Hathewaya histolytica TaxID=1498 RepID=UPI0018815313|nr:hypothetical protein [Staphylococcus epidermidis]
MKSDLYYELLGRINELENRVKMLELQDENKIKEEDNMKVIKDTKISKNEMISNIKGVLTPRLETKGFIVRKAIPKNGEGSGIIIENEDIGNKKKIMIKKSKDYSKQYNLDDEFKFSGWFTSSESELNEYHGYIFAVYKDSVPTYFVFDREDMKSILNSKTVDSKGKYHFYLAEDKNGQYFDHRDGGLLLTGNVEAWEKIKRIIEISDVQYR